MSVDFKEWEFTQAEQKKFSDWMARIMVGHTGTRDVRNPSVNWTPLAKPLSECVVSLFTTGGVHLKSDQPFDIVDAHGDWTFREIPTDINTSDLTITHSHYSHVDADRDVNCMFPLDRLRELCDRGVIGGVAPKAYTIMGFNPNPDNLMEKTAPALARGYQENGADLVFLTCGWPVCHRSLGLVQNHIEGAGVSTIAMSVQPHITATVGTPRAIYLRYPAGNQVGEAGKPQQQRTILQGALEAAAAMTTPGTIWELPYRWRRFPVEEQAVYTGVSHGARHPRAEALGESLDTLVKLAQEYRAYMADRVAQEVAHPSGYSGVKSALQDQVDRIDRFIEILDNNALDQLREIMNRITTMELRVSGKFV